MDSSGPAFARPCGESNEFENDAQRGLSIRDFFAASALTGILAGRGGERFNDFSEVDGNCLAAAISAYAMADAMLHERDNDATGDFGAPPEFTPASAPPKRKAAREPKPSADIGTPPEFRDCPPS